MEPLRTIQPELLYLSAEQIKVLMPYFVAFFGGILAIMLSVIQVLRPKWSVFLVTLATFGFLMFQSGSLISFDSVFLFNDMMVSDAYGNFFNFLFAGSGLLIAMASFRYLDEEKIQHPEYFVLLLFSVLGMMMMASSLDLIVLFIALELMSLCVYALVAFRRSDRRANEASIKYFILGSAASALMLYGVALLYGASGSVNIAEIAQIGNENPILVTPLWMMGATLVVLGFLFKVASVPFHMWMPDVYEGAPVPVTGFMTTGLKAAAFAAFFRVFSTLDLGQSTFVVVESHLHDVTWVVAVLTMILGNFVALTQTNLKRMLAYSSIAHTGYLMMALVVGGQGDLGYAAGVFYLVTYAVMNIGAFVILTILSSDQDSHLNLHDLSGLARKKPWLSFAMAVFMFSMAGIPPTAGFAGKYLLFYSAVQAGEIPLVIIAVLCSAVSVYYYLRVLVYMYMRDEVEQPRQFRISLWSGVAVAATVLLVLQIGIIPEYMVTLAKQAVGSL